MESELKFTELKNGERSRTYVFASGEVQVQNVQYLSVRTSGRHRLVCKDGQKWIITAGWLAIKIDADEWSL